MNLVFTKEEQAKMQQTLSNVVADLRSLYELAEVNTINYKFWLIEGIEEESYYLVIDQNSIYLSSAYNCWWLDLEKVKANKKSKVYPIKDFDFMFKFLLSYEKIREGVVIEAKKSSKQKEKGMAQIDELMNKYAKEAVVEIEMPDSVNQSVIEVCQEDGKNVGRVQVGPISLKIMASSNVKIIEKEESKPGKVKKIK